MNKLTLTDYGFKLSYLGLDPACEYKSGNNGAFKSGSALYFANRAYLDHPTQEELQQVINFFGAQPHTAWIDPSDEGTSSMLRTAGYEKSASYPIMVADIASMHPPQIPVGIEVRQIEKDSPEMETWLTTLAQAYALDKEEFRKFIAYFRSTPAWKQMRFFLATLNGIPAATSMVIDRGNSTGLHWVGTNPEMRGHGLGTVVSAYPFAGLAERGIKEAMLLASDMGKPIYEKIGFKVVGRLDVYKRTQGQKSPI